MPVSSYTDQQVIASIKNKKASDQRALKWFFEDVKYYAIGLWRKKYRNLSDELWEDIFTDSTVKLITRVKNGLTLQEGTKLKSYFTGVVEYTVLDHFARVKKEKIKPIAQIPQVHAVSDNYQFEKAQIANLIKDKLEEITENPEQVSVILLVAKGYKYKEIVQKTAYQSEGACRNAYMKGKKKIVNYILQNPQEGKRLKAMIVGSKF